MSLIHWRNSFYIVLCAKKFQTMQWFSSVCWIIYFPGWECSCNRVQLMKTWANSPKNPLSHWQIAAFPEGWLAPERHVQAPSTIWAVGPSHGTQQSRKACRWKYLIASDYRSSIYINNLLPNIFSPFLAILGSLVCICKIKLLIKVLTST